MPDITFANLEDIHEDLREFATKTGEAYTVNVVPKRKLDEFRDTNIKALQERDTYKAFRDRAIEVLGSDDLDGHFNMLQEHAQIVQRVKDGQLVENKGLDEAIEERVREMKKGYESQITDLSTKARVAEGKAVNVDQKLRRYLVETKVRSAAVGEKIGVIPSAIDDIVSRAFSVFEADEEGNLTPKQGGATLYGPNGGIMTPGEWIASLKDKSPHLFKNSGGGGAPSGDKKFGGFTPAEYEKLTPFQKMELANNPQAFQR